MSRGRARTPSLIRHIRYVTSYRLLLPLFSRNAVQVQPLTNAFYAQWKRDVLKKTKKEQQKYKRTRSPISTSSNLSPLTSQYFHSLFLKLAVLQTIKIYMPSLPFKNPARQNRTPSSLSCPHSFLLCSSFLFNQHRFSIKRFSIQCPRIPFCAKNVSGVTPPSLFQFG